MHARGNLEERDDRRAPPGRPSVMRMRGGGSGTPRSAKMRLANALAWSPKMPERTTWSPRVSSSSNAARSSLTSMRPRHDQRKEYRTAPRPRWLSRRGGSEAARCASTRICCVRARAAARRSTTPMRRKGSDGHPGNRAETQARRTAPPAWPWECPGAAPASSLPERACRGLRWRPA